jgi:hypothetical protein
MISMPLKALAVTILATSALSMSASAAITFELRATAINAVAIPGGTNNIDPSGLAVNDVITIDLYVHVTGVNAGAEGFQLAVMTMNATETAGGVRGDLATAPIGISTIPDPTVPTSWTTKQQLEAAFATGNVGHIAPETAVIDVGATGFKNRIGPLSQTNGNNSSNIFVRAGAIVAGSDFHLYTTSYRVMSVGSSIVNSINMSIPTFTIVNTLQYQVDGAAVNVKNSTGVVFTPLTFAAVPEPSAFGMVLVGALGLVGFRRLGFRRTA